MKICALTFILMGSVWAHAFTLNSPNNPNLEGWRNSNIELLVNLANCPSGIDVVGLISEAADVWNHAPTSRVKVSYGGTTTSTAWSSPTTVYCETNFQAVVGADQNAVPGAAAVDGSTGEITRGVLYLNVSAGQANIANFDSKLLKIILAHEIGHILGLGHSESSSALMYYDASSKQELNLSQDDIDGISYLYPSDELSGDDFAGCARIQNSRPMPPSQTGATLLLLLLPLIAWFSRQVARPRITGILR